VTNNFLYKIESLVINFQSGVRRGVLIAAGILLLLTIPFYFIGQVIASFWMYNSANSNALELVEFFNPKTTTFYNYTVDRSQIVPLANGENVLYTTINNKENPTVGYFPYFYRVQVLNEAGDLVFENQAQTYILPGDIKYIVVNPGNNQGYKLNITEEPQTTATLFNPFANNFANIVNQVQVRNPQIIENEDGQTLDLSAEIKNNSLIEILEVDILYIVRGTRDKVIGIGQQQIINLEAGEEREVFIKYPRPRHRRPLRLDMRIQINYLNSDGFVV